MREQRPGRPTAKHDPMAVEIDLGIPALIPDDYVYDIHQRLMLYKRIANASDQESLDDIRVELIGRFGLLPDYLKNLFSVTEIKLGTQDIGILNTEATDTDTKNNGGLLLNEYTGESTFDLTRMDPALYARVSNLRKGDMTDVFYDEKRGGEKMYKVIIMKDRTDTHIADLVEDYVKVQGLALQKKKQEAIAKWSKDKIGDTYIKISKDFQKCSFEKNWKKETSR